MSHYLQINGQRLIDSLYALGEHGALPGGGVCRLAATAEDKAGRDFVVARMKALGLSVSIDAIGNVTGVYHGEEKMCIRDRYVTQSSPSATSPRRDKRR
ncbi:N-carbamoyl-L-amino-acid hydrolase [Klebsiella pneumoniae]|nr:N-carbamoyl-L-amino-acid hydrolase [Klebsiella pneumoniae]